MASTDRTGSIPEAGGASAFLVCRCGNQACALPIASVVETLRPLPLQALEGMPAHVLGATILRGEPVPVLDGAGLLGSPGAAVGRFVSLRVGQRRVALAVGDVVGVRFITQLGALPPLLKEAASDALQALGTLDGDLLCVLQAARLLPAEVPLP